MRGEPEESPVPPKPRSATAGALFGLAAQAAAPAWSVVGVACFSAGLQVAIKAAIHSHPRRRAGLRFISKRLVLNVEVDAEVHAPQRPGPFAGLFGGVGQSERAPIDLE